MCFLGEIACGKVSRRKHDFLCNYMTIFEGEIGERGVHCKQTEKQLQPDDDHLEQWEGVAPPDPTSGRA